MRGYDFDRQRPIDRYIVDFYCKDLKLAIEIDGSSHDSEEAKINDDIRQERLESLGVRFLRFTDADVKRNIEMVVDSIDLWITDRSCESLARGWTDDLDPIITEIDPRSEKT
jgi:very-short-patch-repair endonuclease